MGGTAIDFSPQRREVYFLLSNLFEFSQKVKFHISKNLIFQKTMIGLVDIMKLIQRVGYGVNP